MNELLLITIPLAEMFLILQCLEITFRKKYDRINMK